MRSDGEDSTRAKDVLTIPSEGLAWVVLHARPRCEKKVVQFCEQNDWPTYLPVRTRMHRYGNREKSFSSPLFAGYVFGVVPDERRSYVRQNRYVANLLDVLDQEKLVAQLKQIQRALDLSDELEVMPYLEKGKTVRVIGGSLKGLEGMILRVKNKARVVINVDMIQQAVAVEVDTAYIGPA